MSVDSSRPWVLHCDGGARGNPGPGAYGFVLADPTGAECEAHAEYLGAVTNNVAEYRGLIAGLGAAGNRGASPLLVRLDSELVVRQMTGEYRVKNEGLKPLHAEARKAAGRIASVRYEAIPRAANARADGLVNEALDRVLGPESPR